MTGESDPEKATLLLKRMADGDLQAAEELLPMVHGQLRRMAHGEMRRQLEPGTLQTTALVNEAWLRLGAASDGEWESKGRFLRVAATAMRNILVDHARARRSQKRGGDRERVPLDDAISAFESNDMDVLDLNDALERLQAKDEDLSRIVELHLFGGLTLEETGGVLGRTVRQVHRSWMLARGFLHREMARGGAGE